jgi:hypothetical protein
VFNEVSEWQIVKIEVSLDPTEFSSRLGILLRNQAGKNSKNLCQTSSLPLFIDQHAGGGRVGIEC